jgi:hypothetical protein
MERPVKPCSFASLKSRPVSFDKERPWLFRWNSRAGHQLLHHPSVSGFETIRAKVRHHLKARGPESHLPEV